MEEVCRLPNGCTLYRVPDEVGGCTYWSDEVGGGVPVWNTSLVAASTLLAALAEEFRQEHERDRARKREAQAREAAQDG